MDQLIVLGTGNATVTKCYNTCFAVKGEEGTILCDAGGGNGILAQFERANMKWDDIHHLLITHAHSDHLLGVVWVLRIIGTMISSKKYEGDLHIYCHSSIIDGLVQMANLTLQKKVTSLIGTRILFHTIFDGQKESICGREITFFDIHSTKLKQFGFTIQLSSGEMLCCLGDEPYNPLCAEYVQSASWLLCEAFCLYEDRDIFKPYEKHHTTVKEACELAQSLSVPNLVIWHTEDKRILERKRLYTAEGQAYYKGNLLVPDDLEVIRLC
ncbi:MAG: MBL fold metallo-hydrolase [Clostridiales bacterium]|nr:MBL fold metallo-hydrolase [Clostridiales bacterium]